MQRQGTRRGAREGTPTGASAARWSILLAVLAASPACRNQTASPAATEGQPSTPTGETGTPGEPGTPPAGEPDVTTDGEEPVRDAAPPPRRRTCPPETAWWSPNVPDPHPEPFTLAEALGDDAASSAAVRVTVETTAGTIECTLDAAGAPRTVANFVGLALGKRPWWDPCRNGWVSEPLYDGMWFHDMRPGFKVQSGCPMGDGTAGPGYAIPDEHSPERRHDAAGVISMANVGPGTAGSQFFITLAPAPQLDRDYVPFGRCGPPEMIEMLDRAARDGTDVVIRRVRSP